MLPVDGPTDLLQFLPPGTQKVQLEPAQSGHLMARCDLFNEFEQQQRRGGVNHPTMHFHADAEKANINKNKNAGYPMVENHMAIILEDAYPQFPAPTARHVHADAIAQITGVITLDCSQQQAVQTLNLLPQRPNASGLHDGLPQESLYSPIHGGLIPVWPRAEDVGAIAALVPKWVPRVHVSSSRYNFRKVGRPHRHTNRSIWHPPELAYQRVGTRWQVEFPPFSDTEPRTCIRPPPALRPQWCIGMPEGERMWIKTPCYGDRNNQPIWKSEPLDPARIMGRHAVSSDALIPRRIPKGGVRNPYGQNAHVWHRPPLFQSPASSPPPAPRLQTQVEYRRAAVPRAAGPVSNQNVWYRGGTAEDRTIEGWTDARAFVMCGIPPGCHDPHPDIAAAILAHASNFEPITADSVNDYLTGRLIDGHTYDFTGPSIFAHGRATDDEVLHYENDYDRSSGEDDTSSDDYTLRRQEAVYHADEVESITTPSRSLGGTTDSSGARHWYGQQEDIHHLPPVDGDRDITESENGSTPEHGPSPPPGPEVVHLSHVAHYGVVIANTQPPRDVPGQAASSSAAAVPETPAAEEALVCACCYCPANIVCACQRNECPNCCSHPNTPEAESSGSMPEPDVLDSSQDDIVLPGQNSTGSA